MKQVMMEVYAKTKLMSVSLSIAAMVNASILLPIFVAIAIWDMKVDIVKTKCKKKRDIKILNG